MGKTERSIGMQCSQGFFRGEKPDVLQETRCIAQQTAAPCRNNGSSSRSATRLTALCSFAITSLEWSEWMSDVEGKVTRVGASERGQRTSFKIVCCNFCKGLFLKAGWRWVDRNSRKRFVTCNRRRIIKLYAQSNQKTVP